jgi:hypothetical protein
VKHWTFKVREAEEVLKKHGAVVTRDRDYIEATWWVDGDAGDAKRCVSVILSSSLIVEDLDLHTTYSAMTLERLRRQTEVYAKCVAALDAIKVIDSTEGGC